MVEWGTEIRRYDPTQPTQLEDALGEYYDTFFEYFFEVVPDDLQFTIRKMETKLDGDRAETGAVTQLEDR